MSEEPSIPTADTSGEVSEVVKPEKPKRKLKSYFDRSPDSKFRPGKEMRDAIIEIEARVAAGWAPDFQTTAEKYGVKRNSLQTLCYRNRKGFIDLGEKPSLAETKEHDARGELQRTLTLAGKLERHLNNVLARLLHDAESDFAKGNVLAHEQLGIPKVVQQLKQVAELRIAKEKGVLDVLAQLTEMNRKIMVPKQIQGVNVPAKPPVSAGAVMHAQRERDLEEILANAQPTEEPVAQEAQ